MFKCIYCGKGKSMNTLLSKDLINAAYSYESYKQLIINLLSENKTTGENQSENLVNYTKLNMDRMQRIEKSTVISRELINYLGKFHRPIVFLVIAEAWCGDVAQNLPVIHLISRLSSNIEMKVVLRDENPDLMERFLTNRGKAIPICILLDSSTLNVIGKWGPRPVPAQLIMTAHKKNPVEPYSVVIKKIQLWYSEDHSQTIQKEFLELLKAVKERKKPGF